ncbi:MAG: hypothetical protein WBC92_02520 [Terracidiphilus sp.]
MTWVALCLIELAGCSGKLQFQAADSGQGANAQSQDPPARSKPVPPTPIAIKKAKLNEPTWDPAWNLIIEDALPSNLLSRRRARDVQPLCPRFRHMSKAERRAFWAYFFQALAGAEAGLKPTADVHHSDPQVDVTDFVTHRPVRQEGLLQLTYMDSLRYDCDFDWRRDKSLPEHFPDKTILQPRKNLLCGVKILEDQLEKRHEPLLSNKSYWSTLRPANPSFPVFEKQMANVPSYCEVSPRSRDLQEKGPAPTVESTNQPPKTSQSASALHSMWSVRPPTSAH